jgi:NAD(P)-dependent dehydrogenase (short-subunit alcohol dehydrogenase family)
MPGVDGLELLRPGLLDGVSIVLAGAGERERQGARCAAVDATCTRLGAQVAYCDPPSEEAALEHAVGRALTEIGELDVLVVDAAGMFAACADRDSALSGCLEASWAITHELVNRAFLAHSRGGRIVYLAPAPELGPAHGRPHADAARAGLENLARTLSIEWARYAITLVTIAPGGAHDAGEVATLVAYLASPAGAYFSGCLFDLRRGSPD